MDLHYLRDARQRYLDEQFACHRAIRETNDPRVIREAGERLDKVQLALDTNAPIFALLDGLDELAARLDALEQRQDLLEQVAEKVWDIAGKERNALAERVAKLETVVAAEAFLNDTTELAERVVVLERVHVPLSGGREWIKGNSPLSDDAYDVDVTEVHE